jgi:formylglycine-generating enzyme
MQSAPSAYARAPVTRIASLLLLCASLEKPSAHPGSGIAVDQNGRVFFTDTGQGIWQIDPNGQVSAHEGSAYHWMALDRATQNLAPWPRFDEPSTSIERVGSNPALLISSDFPIASSQDGAIYYPEFQNGGPLRVFKLDLEGRRTVLATLRASADGADLQWLNGLATGPGGSLYFTENSAVRRITPQGVVSTVARNIRVADCRRIPGAPEQLGPLLRGLDVAQDGTVYVAASACGTLLKINPQGLATPVLRLEPPWSPTGVAIKGGDIYVLEYLHTSGGDRREWLPRVRKISIASGTNTIIAAIERSGPDTSRPVMAPNPAAGKKAGDEIELRGVKLCWCPPGTFRMGSPETEPGHRPDELQVSVTLTQGFWIGKYEVTQAQWRRVMGETRRQLNAGVGDDFPVYWVNFHDAEEFCRKLTAQARASGELPAGWHFRLPTEAQWEYACRAGTTTPFSFGATLATHHANIGQPYNGTPTGEPGSAASAVGSYPANPWGLHDMHGNEFEWCRDWYHARLPGGTDPFHSQPGSPNRDGSFSRVRRGGAWMDPPDFCRSAFRLRFEPDRASDHIGLRVALTRD